MAVITGTDAKVVIGGSNIVDCQGWSWERTVTENAYASCSTSGFKKRLPGVKDHSGSINGLFDPESPPDDYFDEGDLVTLLLYVNSSAFYSVPAMIITLSVEANNDEGELIPWSADFGGNGAWSSSGL